METKEIKINLPIDLTTLDEIGNVTATIENGSIVIMCEPKKKEFKFGDFVRLDKSGNTGIIETVGNYDCLVSVNGIVYRVNKNDISEASEDEKNKIQKFLDDNNLVIDYEKKEIRKKRWRAEKQETFYYISEYGTVLSAVETLKTCDDYIYKYGNYFRTKKIAEIVAKEIRDIFEKHKNG
jgi:hypothetical protein